MKSTLTNKIRRHRRVRSKIQGSKEIPRVSVFRSNKHFSVQLIDDVDGKTLMSVSDIADKKGNLPAGKAGKMKEDGIKPLKGKSNSASVLGTILGKQALAKGITKVVFDRGSYRYHGRVKALAEELRKAGLKF